jgi:hypothetical protein
VIGLSEIATRVTGRNVAGFVPQARGGRDGCKAYKEGRARRRVVECFARGDLAAFHKTMRVECRLSLHRTTLVLFGPRDVR